MRSPFLAWLVVVLLMTSSSAMANEIMFDHEERIEALEQASDAVKSHCWGENLSMIDEEMPQPFPALKSTNEYGSDTSASEFSRYIMLHSGRALAGNAASQQIIKDILLLWANASALMQTEASHDSYYALKRMLMPTIMAYSFVRDDYTTKQREKIDHWLDDLVRRIDQKFDGDVDQNNHRYLADSVLMAWGALIGDDTLYQKGIERYKQAINALEEDGGLALENRRGARALWYIRQSLANLLVMAEIAEHHGDDLYSYEHQGRTYHSLLSYYIAALQNNLLILSDAAENYIAGPSQNFFEQDMGMMDKRGDRHYMAFGEAYMSRFKNSGFVANRFSSLMEKEVLLERPLVDEFVGGNATCFWQGV